MRGKADLTSLAFAHRSISFSLLFSFCLQSPDRTTLVIQREEGAGEAAANDGLSADELVEELSDLLTLKAQNKSSPLDDLALLGSVDGNSVAGLQVALGGVGLAASGSASGSGGHWH